MKKTIEIDGHKIGPGKRPYIIAELSCNHNGSIEKAYRIMEKVAATGVDAIKLQTYEADSITMDGPQDFYRLNHKLWNNMSYYELYKKAETPFSWMEKLFAKGKELGITVFSTPFDETAADLLIGLDAPAFKIASFENGHIPLIEKVARTGKPLIMSTGMISEEEIGIAVKTARDAGCKDLILLHCVSAYPGRIEDLNLATITDMEKKFDVMVGLSNHYIGPSPTHPDLEAIYAAFKQGAVALEMHVMENEEDRTFDDAFSITPESFRSLVDGVDAGIKGPLTEKQKLAVGTVNYEIAEGEKGSIPIRPAIKASRAIKKGEVFTAENMVVRRPNVGLNPQHWHSLIGKTANQDIDFADGITAEMVREKL
ncbi:MAG: pseI [Micavibrio sp.]|nr:pseI [Micavibrio sp.]